MSLYSHCPFCKQALVVIVIILFENELVSYYSYRPWCEQAIRHQSADETIFLSLILENKKFKTLILRERIYCI